MQKLNESKNIPFYQGKVDNFCAGYAVLNAIKILRNISGLQGRVVLNEMLYHESLDGENWLKVLNHETDYNNLVIRMLNVWKDIYKYNYFRPFDPKHYGFSESHYQGEKIRKNIDMRKPEISIDDVWNVFKNCTIPKEKTVVFRLCRFVPFTSGPLVDHWTTSFEFKKDVMHFYDCSLEASGWYTLEKEKVFIAPFHSIPAQTIGLRDKFLLNLDTQEFAVICPEFIHVLEAKNYNSV